MMNLRKTLDGRGISPSNKFWKQEYATWYIIRLISDGEVNFILIFDDEIISLRTFDVDTWTLAG